MKAVQSRLDSSIRRLKTLQTDDSEEEKPAEYKEMAETFYAQLSQPRMMTLK
jgi:hypothetical protein